MNTKKKFILSFDEGTTGITVALINAKSLDIEVIENYPFAQIYPRPGEVEHDLELVWTTLNKGIKAVIKRAEIDAARDILCIGITNQRETTCAFDKKGRPLGHALVWQDKRTTERCLELKKQKGERWLQKKTGLPFDPYFSATKVQWLLANNPKVQSAHKKGDLLFGTVDTYLLYRLTNGESFYTDASNASRTALMNIHTGAWDPELLDLFEVEKTHLAEIKDSFGPFGKTKGHPVLPDGIPITGILGDQQSALLGQGCTEKGELKCTYGTGAFLLLNTGETPLFNESGILTTVAYRQAGKLCYALEGSSFIAGAAVGWLRDNLKIIPESRRVEDLALTVKNLEEMKNVLFLPFFAGLGSPYWIPSATASILGLTRDTHIGHICRAVLEGIAFSINDLMGEFHKIQIQQMKVDGGAAENNLLMKIQASILGRPIVRPQIIETTVYGAALAAAIGEEIIDFKEVKKHWKQEQVFSPEKSWGEYYNFKRGQWKDIIQKFYLKS